VFGLDVAGQEEVTSRLTFTVSTRNRRSQEEIIFVPRSAVAVIRHVALPDFVGSR
jgi:hypothetical protein